MKFSGPPGLIVTVNKPRKGEVKRLKFDANGVYETHHAVTARRMMKKFAVIEEAKPELKKCKKCEFACENQGDLLAHYRKEHPKERE